MVVSLATRFRAMDDVRALHRGAMGALAPFRLQLGGPVLEELAQEAVIVGHQLAGVRNRRAFVRQVARHLAVDHVRRTREDRTDPERVSVDPWPQVDAGLDLDRAADLLDRAPPNHKKTLQALVLNELDFEEVVLAEARALGGDPTDPETVARARDTLYKRRRRAIAWMREARDG